MSKINKTKFAKFLLRVSARSCNIVILAGGSEAGMNCDIS